jgi:hypothetical protein
MKDLGTFNYARAQLLSVDLFVLMNVNQVLKSDENFGKTC